MIVTVVGAAVMVVGLVAVIRSVIIVMSRGARTRFLDPWGTLLAGAGLMLFGQILIS